MSRATDCMGSLSPISNPGRSAFFQAQAQFVVLRDHGLKFHGFLYQRTQPLHVNRLGQIIIRALFHRGDRAFNRAVGRHEDEQRVVVPFAHTREQFQPAESRHLDVRNDQVVEMFRGQFQRCLRIRRRVHLVAFPLQRLLQAGAKALLIVHNQNFNF
jgi:hypothetical protein